MLLGAAQAGSVSGTVVDGAGAPVAGALVTYNNVVDMQPSMTGAPVPNGPIVGAALSTGQDGTFSASIPPGTYYFCAAGVKPTHIGTCGPGGTGAAAIQLSAGQSIQGLTLQIVDGALVTISVRDASGKVHELTDTPVVDGHIPLSGANFAVGLFVGSWYARVPLLSAQNGVRRYQLAVPRDGSVSLYLDTDLAATDQNGTAVPTRQAGVAVPANGQAALAFSVVIP
jgi:hypothetical protein